MMNSKELTVRLHGNEIITLAMIDTLELHAAVLSKNICHDLEILNAIVLRHEALIRLR